MEIKSRHSFKSAIIDRVTGKYRAKKRRYLCVGCKVRKRTGKIRDTSGNSDRSTYYANTQKMA